MTFVIVMDFHQIIVVMNDVKRHTYIHYYYYYYYYVEKKQMVSYRADVNIGSSRENRFRVNIGTGNE